MDDLEKMKAENEALKKEIEIKNRQLSEALAVQETAEERELTKDEKAMIAEGCKAYGIAERYVLKARVEKTADEKVAVIITHGGAKVHYAKSMDPKKIVPLEAHQVDGIIRKKMKPVTGAKR
jgi:prolyl-tRNA editing enzyme YbaK/EbsC (Cys-tRNA(Pro) deacylase)